MDSDGNTLCVFSVPNNKDGADKLYEKLRYTILHADFTKISIGMESTSVYGEHLTAFLQKDEFLRKWDCKVYTLNAKQVRKFKDAYTDLPKTDNTDTLIIADYLRFGRHSAEVRHDEKYLALRNLTRARFQAAQNLSREKTRFIETLFLKFSTLLP